MRANALADAPREERLRPQQFRLGIKIADSAVNDAAAAVVLVMRQLVGWVPARSSIFCRRAVRAASGLSTPYSSSNCSRSRTAGATWRLTAGSVTTARESASSANRRSWPGWAQGGMEIADVARQAEGLSGVRHTVRDGLAEWRYHGRLVARQLADAHMVIRADFDYRDSILRQFPGTFSVPRRFVRHMMMVADLATGDTGAIEDAIEAAWQLQRSTN